MKRIIQPKISGAGKISPPQISSEKSSVFSKPFFSFQYLTCKDYDLDACSREEKVALVSRLVKLSMMTWDEIHASDRHAYGVEKIPRKQLKRTVPSSVTEETSFTVFRFTSNKQPMVGFRTENVFHILFLDPKFSLYEH